MGDLGRFFWLGVGLLLGLCGAGLLFSQAPVLQAGNDRYQDYIIATGAVALNARAPTDGVWLLDYRAGKLLGTVIDRGLGKIIGWAEVDLVNEFGIPPRQDVHFMMTTGQIAVGQSALYVAETTTGKFGVYTLQPRPDGQSGFMINRHDMVQFRQPPQALRN